MDDERAQWLARIERALAQFKGGSLDDEARGRQREPKKEDEAHERAVAY